MDAIRTDLNDKGYCIIPNVLSENEIDICKQSFHKWLYSIPQYDIISKNVIHNGIYKYYHAGHTWHAWYIRTHPYIQRIFKYLFDCDELIVSFDGCCYISKQDDTKDSCWTHTDQAPSTKGFQCYQGLVSLTNNKERTLVVYEKTHLLHETYFKERGICHTNNWHVIDKSDVEKMEYKKKILHVPAGSLVLWDSRLFHQNQFGKQCSEERMVQYICYLPKSHPNNTSSTKIERLNCFENRLTTTHWPAPLFINRLIPCPNKYPFLEQNDISSCTLQDLSNIDKKSIMKLIL